MNHNLLYIVGLGLVCVAALASLVVSLFTFVRVHGVLPRLYGSAELITMIRQQALQLNELYDRVEHWTRRDRVRRVREGQEAKAEALNGRDGDDLVTVDDIRELTKDELRARYLTDDGT